MNSFLVAFLIIVVFLILMFSIRSCKNVRSSEGFDATGLVFNVPPNWFIKQDYDVNQWFVRNYNDAIQPNCLSYDKASKYGSLENINYLANALRFWRF